jgi:hypothetical protein
MLKDNILQILDINKEIIKNVFSIDDDGINNIRDILKKDHENFKQIVDDIFLSDAGIREKMVMCYMMGYVNGERKEKLMSRVAKTL